MTEPSHDPHTNDEPGAHRSREPSPGRPGWQKAIWILGILVLIGLAILLATGEHGPGRHAPEADPQQDEDAGGPEGHDPSQWNH